MIELGGVEVGGQSTEQKHHLALYACVGTMIEYSDPKGGKAATNAFVSNLS